MDIPSHAHESVVEYIRSQQPEQRFTIVEQTGWYDDAFVFPEEIIEKEPSGIVYQGLRSNDLFRTRGDLADWQTEVARRCSGNSRLILAVCCAFAGPVLRLLGEESGGHHLYGGTGCGKTTAQIVGGSVWGGGAKDGFVKSWRSTLNGLENIAAAHNDTCLFLDELGQLDPKNAAETPYLLANGHAKERMNADGSMRPRTSWRLQFLSTGELTLNQVAQTVGSKTRGGMEVRLISVPADAGKGSGLFEKLHDTSDPAQFSRLLRDAAKEHFGTAGRAFVELLLWERDECVTFMRQRISDFEDRHTPQEASADVRRAIRRFAVLASAGELASFYAVTGWVDGEAEDGCAACLRSWLNQRGTSVSHDGEEMIRQVRHFLQAHGSSRFSPLSMLPSSKISNMAGCRTGSSGKVVYLFFTEVFKAEVCRGFDPQEVISHLRKAGHLVADSQRNDKQERMPVGGRMRFYGVRDSILNE